MQFNGKSDPFFCWHRGSNSKGKLAIEKIANFYLIPFIPNITKTFDLENLKTGGINFSAIDQINLNFHLNPSKIDFVENNSKITWPNSCQTIYLFGIRMQQFIIFNGMFGPRFIC